MDCLLAAVTLWLSVVSEEWQENRFWSQRLTPRVLAKSRAQVGFVPSNHAEIRMNLVDYPPFARLRALSSDKLDSCRFILERGHSGPVPPYSTPFHFRVETQDGYIAWWGSLNFDQLHAKTGYSSVALLARYCSSVLSIAEGRESHDDAPTRDSVQKGVFPLMRRSSDPYHLADPDDMRSRRAEFERKSWAELSSSDPREFHVYVMNTVIAANSRRSEERLEFRVVSRPEAKHRWLFWTQFPGRVWDTPLETAYWFERYVAQLRGTRKPSWDATQKQRWLNAVYVELTGKTSKELELDALAADPADKPDLLLVLGKEDSVGSVVCWSVPRAAFNDAVCRGTDLELAFVDSRDGKRKRARLIFRTTDAAREALAGIASGLRRRLGVGKELRGILGADSDAPFSVLVGMNAEEEDEHRDSFARFIGKTPTDYRNGLVLHWFSYP